MPVEAEKSTNPMHYLLSADARFSVVDFANDHTWELTTLLNEPPAIMIHTTYGLRAHWMRLFPSFTSAGATLTDPRTFAEPPQAASPFSSYAEIRFSPFPHFDVCMEVYVPSSAGICGRVTVTNTGNQLENWKIALNAVLNPLSRGQQMTAGVYGLNTVLQGSTQSITPVLYVTGGPEPSQSPYSALTIPLTLQPGHSRKITWALASLRTLEESFNQARQMTGYAFEPVLLRCEMAQRKHAYRVNTSLPEWDRVFEYSQRQTMQLLMSGPIQHPGRIFVLSRKPDHGFSANGNGSDYLPAWIGQTALNTWVFCKLILPGYTEIARELLSSFLTTQRPDGFISNQLEIGGHPAPDHAFPILAEIARLIFSYDEDLDWLRLVYPSLMDYLRHWFEGNIDEDVADLPAWSNAIQAGVDDLPEYAREENHSLAEILPNLHSPSLFSFLYRESSNLLEFARRLENVDDAEWLLAQQQKLSAGLEKCWHSQSKSYRHVDAQAEMILRPQKLAVIKKNGKTALTKPLKSPGRLMLEMRPGLPASPRLLITLHGSINGVPVSRKVVHKNFTWTPRGGSAFCSTLFDSVDTITVQGLEPGTSLAIFQPDSSQEEITQLLPLWAGIPDQERAGQLVRKTILSRYITDHGLSSAPRSKTTGTFPEDAEVPLVWNMFILEGLNRYGFVQEASEISKALIQSWSQLLERTGSMYPAINLNTLKPCGEPDSLNSLFPTLDFVKQLGVDQWSEKGMIVNWTNSFFRPITVEYNRIKTTFRLDETEVETINGDKQSITAPPAKLIRFGSGKEKNERD